MASSHSSPEHTVWPHPAECHPHASPQLDKGGRRISESIHDGDRLAGDPGTADCFN